MLFSLEGFIMRVLYVLLVEYINLEGSPKMNECIVVYIIFPIEFLTLSLVVVLVMVIEPFFC